MKLRHPLEIDRRRTFRIELQREQNAEPFGIRVRGGERLRHVDPFRCRLKGARLQNEIGVFLRPTVSVEIELSHLSTAKRSALVGAWSQLFQIEKEQRHVGVHIGLQSGVDRRVGRVNVQKKIQLLRLLVEFVLAEQFVAFGRRTFDAAIEKNFERVIRFVLCS